MIMPGLKVANKLEPLGPQLTVYGVRVTEDHRAETQFLLYIGGSFEWCPAVNFMPADDLIIDRIDETDETARCAGCGKQMYDPYSAFRIHCLICGNKKTNPEISGAGSGLRGAAAE